jgi:putative thioredoxin
MAGANVVEFTDSNFADEVLQSSTPVLVDFWATWCAPCKALMPILEKLAIEYDGRFILAKINSDENQNIAQQLGVRSLPTIKMFKEGQPVDEFMGALPESEVRAFIDKHVAAAVSDTPAADSRMTQAMAAFEQGDAETAKTLLVELYNEDPKNGETALALGQVSMAAGDYASAELVLKNLSEEDAASHEGVRLKAMMTLSTADTSEKDIETLATEADNGSSESRYHYAIKLALQSQLEPAIEQLLKLMVKDREFADDGARKCLITIFDVMGADPLVGKYRRKMFNLLH